MSSAKKAMRVKLKRYIGLEMLSDEDMDAWWARVEKKREEFWQEFFDRHFKDSSMPLESPRKPAGEFK